ncbi:MAG: hypothetical protein JST26_06250 [Bacteroidetes bacterium]|nr:hypothetical protein [Bacteroidota bacterium]
MESLESKQTADIDEVRSNKRPSFLTVLCVLSLIWEILLSLLALLALCFSGFIFEAVQNFVNDDQMAKVSAEQIEAMNQLLNIGEGKFAVIMGGFMLAYGVSIFGVAKMWKQKKVGFYVYTTVNILLMIINIYRGGYFDAVVTIAFIAMYAANLKHMK